MNKYLEFHEYTKNFKGIPFAPREYNVLIEPKKYFFSQKLKITSENVRIDLIKVLKNRETVRDIKNSKLNKEKMFNILYYSLFSNKKRAYPSAGARYPVELYLVSFNVNNVKNGIYYINQFDKNLYLIKEGNYKREFYNMSQNQEFMLNSMFLIVMTANFERTITKYGERGYRYIFLDAGHIGQNFALVSYGEHVNCIPIGGFYDDEINEILNISKQEQAIYMMCFGK